MFNSKYSFLDKDTNWNSPNKTLKEKKILHNRGKKLNEMQQYPLNVKILMAQDRIKEVVDKFGTDTCYLGFSGGKDSTILSHIITKMGYKIDHVYSNTRLEYADCTRFTHEWVKKHKLNLITVYPEVMPVDIWKKYGYPMFSKEVADILERVRTKQKVNPKKLKRITSYLKYKNIKLSSRCCYYLKKKPMKDWQKTANKKVAILGVRAEESQMRRTLWVRKGCIYETNKNIIVQPIIFFTDKDIREYAKIHKIKFADIYQKGFDRNGCICCGFGAHLSENNNFIKLKRLNPVLWKNVMDKWGFRGICKRCNVKVE